MKIGIVSLGCAKNRVDSEAIAYLFQSNDIEIVNDVQDADIILVNTCGFILDAKKESIDTILEMASYHKFLIVTGCLVERYQKELEEALPEVNLFISIDEYPHFAEKVREALKQQEFKGDFTFVNRVLSTPPYTAYLKISEGCNNCCHYCAIPLIRGRFHSYLPEDLLKQAKDIASKGVKELVVISQDTTRYGEDLKNVNIVSLLKELLKIQEFEYIRLLYLYPDEISDELIDLIGSEKRLTPYFDIPIQHCSDHLLKAMNRRGDKAFLVSLFKKIRQRVPHCLLRTTLIVGYPGETEEDIDELIDFMKEVRFDHLGCFTYSPEDGTVGATLPNQIPEKVKQKRYQRVMKAQEKISYENNQKRIGVVTDGLIIGFDEERKAYLIRNEFNAPDDIDGKIYVYSDHLLAIATMVKFKIIDAESYDLFGEIVE